MIKVLLHTHYEFMARPAGAERYTNNAVEFLQKQGYEFRYLVRNDVGYIMKATEYVGSNNVPCYVENDDESNYHEHYEWADLVWTHLGFTEKAVKLAHKYDKPITVVLHSDKQLQAIGNYEVDLIVCNADWVRKYVEVTGHHAKRLHTLIPPFSVDKFAVPEDKHDRYYCSHVNCNEGKGVMHALTLARQTKDFYPWLFCAGAYDIQMVPKGKMIEDPVTKQSLPVTNIMTRKLHLRSKEVKYPENAEFILPTQNIRDDVYAKTKLMWSLSSIDTWGMVALEAFCSGIPVVAHYHKGFAESMAALPQGKVLTPSAGFIVDREAGQTCYNLCVRLMDDKPFYDECSALARVRAHEVESLAQSQLHELDSLLKEIVNG